MNAIRIEVTGGPEVLRPAQVERPTVGPGELLLRQRVAGVNYIDVYLRLGIYPHALPFVPGREGVGVVEALGADVAGWSVGTRVAYCDTPHLGAYAEYSVVPERFCVELPDAIPDDVGAAAMVQGLTAQYLVTDSHRVEPGQTVLVHAAAGGAGRLLVQFAKQYGARVIATAGGPEKVALARSAGADEVIDYRAVDFEPAVKQLAPGGVDAVYDSVGKDTWERGLRLLRPRGSFVLFGASSGPVPPIDPQRLSAAGSIFFSRPTLAHFTRTHGELSERADAVFDGITSGWLGVRVFRRYPLAEAAQAHRDLESRTTTGKLVLVP